MLYFLLYKADNMETIRRREISDFSTKIWDKNTTICQVYTSSRLLGRENII